MLVVLTFAPPPPPPPPQSEHTSKLMQSNATQYPENATHDEGKKSLVSPPPPPPLSMPAPPTKSLSHPPAPSLPGTSLATAKDSFKGPPPPPPPPTPPSSTNQASSSSIPPPPPQLWRLTQTRSASEYFHIRLCSQASPPPTTHPDILALTTQFSSLFQTPTPIPLLILNNISRFLLLCFSRTL